jgi:hypothetical protein
LAAIEKSLSACGYQVRSRNTSVTRDRLNLLELQGVGRVTMVRPLRLG